MAIRMILMLIVIAAAIAALGLMKLKQIEATAGLAASFQRPPEAVTTNVARQEKWPVTLSMIGTVAASSRRQRKRRSCGEK